jgi:integrase
MARTVRDATLETRTARLRLEFRKKPYWRGLDRALHLGYYRGAKGGGWIGRRYAGQGRYQETTLGTADDIQDADGVAVLSYSQAQARAREWFAAEERKAAGLDNGDGDDGPYTVRDAATAYLAWFKEHRKSYADTKRAIDAHILPELGDIEVTRLTTARIRAWHEGLAKAPARLRTKPGKRQRYREAAGDPEAIRARRATANRVLTNLKALLTHAFCAGKVASDLAWRRVRPFREVDAARERFLEPDEMTRLCNACEPDFRRIVRAALLTGARYGELCQANVQDYSRAARKLQVRLSKGGKPRWIPLDDEAVEFFEQITAGRPPSAIMFPRADGKRWGRSHQQRRLTEASAAARIDQSITYHGLRHTWASRRVMRGADLLVVAKVLGHRDTRMVERHYGHLRPSCVDDAIRATGSPTFRAGESNVERLPVASNSSVLLVQNERSSGGLGRVSLERSR